MSKSIIYMLEQLYQDKLQETKYDVMYCIKGFMKSYAELFIFSDMPLDLEQLAKSLAEKKQILLHDIQRYLLLRRSLLLL
ncbi:hypothetical protein OL548_11210 [Lysinibacillus sp. MHQ-1]|nr:hypothetical protein OL548_11210 [Lysinibacillus sp. MHQ-1]